jgi:hypothetical protein
MKRLLLCFAFLAAGSGATSAQLSAEKPLPVQPIGRLFFTPGERAQLDVARVQKRPLPEAVAAAAAPEAPPLPQTVTYGGIVRRSDGKAMLWINNRLVEEKEALAGLNLRGKVRPDGAVTLQVPQTGGSINVKVGQSVELHTGKVGEARKPEPKPPGEDTAATAAQAKAGAAPPPAQSEPPPPAAAPAAAKAPEPPVGDRKPEASGNVGLKLDMGSARK